jgi:hypothetical protein
VYIPANDASQRATLYATADGVAPAAPVHCRGCLCGPPLPFTSAVDHQDVLSPYRLVRICLTSLLQRERGAHEHPELAGVNHP